MYRTLSIDLTRLLLSPMRVTPRGIDRIEFAYARHFAESWPGEFAPIIPTPWGLRWFDRRRTLAGLKFISDHWHETLSPEQDPVYRSVRARLLGRSAVANAGRPSRRAQIAGYLRGLSATDLSFGQSVPRALPRGSIYLNVGHTGLSWSPLVSWLARRTDVTSVFMLHDVIPIEYPEYVTAAEAKAHRAMIANTSRFAKGLIVTTESARTSILRQLESYGRKDIAICKMLLPVPSAFDGTVEADPELRSIPYFIACGAIETRKNYLLLLDIWRELVSKDGAAAPRLVIVGSRSDTSDATVEIIDRSELLRDHVIEAAGLSTPGLRRLLVGSCALLMPSFAEGFGLPIVEALSQGTPVVASDIAAHREVGGKFASYLDATDRLGWMEVIRAHAQMHESAPPNDRRTEGFHWISWAEYFKSIELFIASLTD